MGKHILGFLIGATLLFANTENLFAQNNQDTETYTYDAILHFTISTEISFSSCMFFTLLDPEVPLIKKYLMASGVGLFIGFGKELADMIYSFFDWRDIGFDVLGIGTGIVLHYFVFDRKMKRNSISLNLSEDFYMASIKIYF